MKFSLLCLSLPLHALRRSLNSHTPKLPDNPYLATQLADEKAKQLPKQKQLAFHKTLYDMAEVLDRHGVQFALSFGTALGVRRENAFIVHDHDIDLSTLQDVEELAKKLRNDDSFNNNFVIKNIYGREWGNATEVAFLHKSERVPLDIFRFFKGADDTFVSYLYFDTCKKKKSHRCELHFPHESEQIRFGARTYDVPTASFLDANYGQNWNISKQWTYHESLQGDNRPSIANFNAPFFD